MFRSNLMIAGCLTAALAAGAAFAQDQREVPAALKEVLDCRAIAEREARLDCYDKQVSLLEAARTRDDLIVVDREQVQEAKRGLFGLTLPQLKLFSRGGEEEVSEVESTIAAIRYDPAGKFVFILKDGAKWVQSDTRVVRPKVGDTIRIRKAAMGSFLANINGATAIRVRREN
ncbi:hypothetical protein ACLBKU_01605 [Erythrobacter sp. NE805]|uniref:hypothetical protein n=1 Tax=Erythrobacter sp. NE805 TaxID=3389875 RepID=UPI00396B3479